MKYLTDEGKLLKINKHSCVLGLCKPDSFLLLGIKNIVYVYVATVFAY